jgi:hypothetical protein
VLIHPRYLNCHTATNYPQQGEDRESKYRTMKRQLSNFLNYLEIEDLLV